MNCIERREYKIMVVKLTYMFQIIWHCHKVENILVDDFQHHPFLFIEQNIIFFTELKITLKRQGSL